MAEPGKKAKDYSEEAKSAISSAWDVGRVKATLTHLRGVLTIHNRHRASDAPSTTLLVQAILGIAYESKDYGFVLECLNALSKKHGQFKTSTTAMIDLVMGWLPAIKEEEGIKVWLEWIFLETPRARVTLALALYHEELANKPTADSPKASECLQTASDLLQELQVETYSSMELREKIEILLEQMRLLMLVAKMKDEQAKATGGLTDGEADWVKMRVGARKVNEGFINNPDNKDLKLKYHELMIQHSLRQSAYLEVAKSFYKIWEMPSVQEDQEGAARHALENIVYYLILAPYDNEQSDMINRLFIDPALSKPQREAHYNLVKRFVTKELMRWSGIQEYFGPILSNTEVFSGPLGERHYKDLHMRVTEHISLQRLTDLLVLSKEKTEEILSRLVVSGTVWARIDRPAGIVNFRQKRSAEDVMNEWSSDMNKMLGLVEKAWMAMNAEVAAR
ncbi:2032_t:CDS:2, partial [Acaulospora colombiana]